MYLTSVIFVKKNSKILNNKEGIEIFRANHSKCYTQNQIFEVCDNLIKQKISTEVNNAK